MIFCYTYFCIFVELIQRFFSTLNFSFFSVLFVARQRKDYAERGGGRGGSLEPRLAIELSFSAGGGGLEKPNSGRESGDTFFPDSGSDLDSDETFQI